MPKKSKVEDKEKEVKKTSMEKTMEVFAPLILKEKEKEVEWEDDDTMMWPGEIHAPGELYVKMSKVKQKLAEKDKEYKELEDKYNTLKAKVGAIRKEKDDALKFQSEATACRQWLTEAQDSLKEKDKEIEKKDKAIGSILFVMQMVHDRVPHGPGVHKVMRDTIAKYKSPPPKVDGLGFRCKKCHTIVNRDMVPMKEMDTDKVVHESEYFSCPNCGLIDEEDIYDPTTEKVEDQS